MSGGVDTVADLIRRDARPFSPQVRRPHHGGFPDAPRSAGNEARLGDSSTCGAAGYLSPAAPSFEEVPEAGAARDAEALVRCLRAGSERVRLIATPEGHDIQVKLAGTRFTLEPRTALGIGLALIDAATQAAAR